MKPLIKWFARQIEAHPMAWRVLLILLCIFAVGYVGTDDNKYFEQMKQCSTEVPR